MVTTAKTIPPKVTTDDCNFNHGNADGIREWHIRFREAAFTAMPMMSSLGDGSWGTCGNSASVVRNAVSWAVEAFDTRRQGVSPFQPAVESSSAINAIFVGMYTTIVAELPVPGGFAAGQASGFFPPQR
jgi:hypothetical protein